MLGIHLNPFFEAVGSAVSGVGNFVGDTVGGVVDNAFGLANNIVSGAFGTVNSTVQVVGGVANGLVDTGFNIALPNGTTIGANGRDNQYNTNGLDTSNNSMFMYVGLAIIVLFMFFKK